jgi:hypothetical protein
LRVGSWQVFWFYDIFVECFNGFSSAHLSVYWRQSIFCQRSPPCGNFPPSDKNRKVHKMCARYREIPDIKFRQELGLGPIVNWFAPAPVLSVMMLPPPPSATKTSRQLCSPLDSFLLGFGCVWKTEPLSFLRRCIVKTPVLARRQSHAKLQSS